MTPNQVNTICDILKRLTDKGICYSVNGMGISWNDDGNLIFQVSSSLDTASYLIDQDGAELEYIY